MDYNLRSRNVLHGATISNNQESISKGRCGEKWNHFLTLSRFAKTNIAPGRSGNGNAIY
jgi:hypothetical protein